MDVPCDGIVSIMPVIRVGPAEPERDHSTMIHHQCVMTRMPVVYPWIYHVYQPSIYMVYPCISESMLIMRGKGGPQTRKAQPDCRQPFPSVPGPGGGGDGSGGGGVVGVFQFRSLVAGNDFQVHLGDSERWGRGPGCRAFRAGDQCGDQLVRRLPVL